MVRIILLAIALICVIVAMCYREPSYLINEEFEDCGFDEREPWVLDEGIQYSQCIMPINSVIGEQYISVQYNISYLVWLTPEGAVWYQFPTDYKQNKGE